MAIDTRQAVSAAEDGPPLADVALAGTGYSCSGCGYGIAVAGALPSCPMCGADAWVPERIRPGGATLWPH